MIEAALIGSLLGLGIIILLRGAYPPRATLAERISSVDTPLLGYDPDEDDDLPEQSIERMRQRFAMYVLRTAKGEKIKDVQADVAVSQGDLLTHALDKLSGAVGVMILALVIGMMTGFVSTFIGGIVVACAGAAAGYIIPDFELAKKAKQGRFEFERALNTFVGLVSVSMSGGGGLNTAMADAASVGSGWVFESLRATLTDAQLRNEPAARALDRLGHQLNVEGLIELAGALSLAGESGARVTDTLIARAETGREKELSEARTLAEKTSANLGIPVGALIFGWLGFLGYPAILNLVQGLT